jgi:hypothetical protein
MALGAKAHTAPSLVQIEQLHLSAVDGSISTVKATAPQWQLPEYVWPAMVSSWIVYRMVNAAAYPRQ